MNAAGNYIGGLVGYSIGNIDSCSSESNVIGINKVGGLIGYLYTENKDLTIENSKATGNVSGTTNVGGLIGHSFINHTNTASNTKYWMYVKKSYATRRYNSNTEIM